MSEPFIFVTTNTINEGQLERVNELSTEFTELVEAGDTGLLGFHFYLNEDGTELSNVQVRDAASMDAYLPTVQQLIQQALELTTTTSIDVYGTPGPVAQQVLRMNAEQGVRVRVKRDRINGFVRPASV
jgi:hypothetical protein